MCSRRIFHTQPILYSRNVNFSVIKFSENLFGLYRILSGYQYIISNIYQSSYPSERITLLNYTLFISYNFEKT